MIGPNIIQHGTRGVLPATAFVVASDAPSSIVAEARAFKGRYGDLVQICDGTADNIQIQAAIDAINSTGVRGVVALVGGSFAAATTITAKSGVDVQMNGATITVTSNSDISALSMSSIVNSVWSDGTIVRAGSPTGEALAAIRILGTTDNTVKLINMKATNQGDTAERQYGIYIDGSSSPVLVDVYALGSGTARGYGLVIEETSSPRLENVTGEGGGTGTSNMGVVISNATRPMLLGVTGKGGAGTDSDGIHIGTATTATLLNCEAISGSGNANNALYVGGSVNARIVGMNAHPPITGHNWTYAAANNGRFQPYASPAYQLLTVAVDVVSANVGVTLDIGTSASGTQVASGIDIGSTGKKYPALVLVTVASGAYLYATPSAGITDGDVVIMYSVIENTASDSLRLDTRGHVVIVGSSFTSPAAGDAVHITAVSVTDADWAIHNSSLINLSPGTGNALNAATQLSFAPIYKSVVDGVAANIHPKDWTLDYTHGVGATFPTNAGWTAVNVGSGGSSQTPFYLDLYTDTTANSSALLHSRTGHFATGTSFPNITWDKPIVFRFFLNRATSESESVIYVQLKEVLTIGDLAADGIGVKITNLTLYGESYGSSQATVDLSTTLVSGQGYDIEIRHYPEGKIEWYVNGVLAGSQTTAAKIPSGNPGAVSYIVVSIANGGTGGTSALLRVGFPTIWQGR